MALLAHQILENRGFKVKEEHVDLLEVRYENLLRMKEKVTNDVPDHIDISLRNIPGGDHLD